MWILIHRAKKAVMPEAATVNLWFILDFCVPTIFWPSQCTLLMQNYISICHRKRACLVCWISLFCICYLSCVIQYFHFYFLLMILIVIFIVIVSFQQELFTLPYTIAVHCGSPAAATFSIRQCSQSNKKCKKQIFQHFNYCILEFTHVLRRPCGQFICHRIFSFTAFDLNCTVASNKVGVSSLGLSSASQEQSCSCSA